MAQQPNLFPPNPREPHSHTPSAAGGEISTRPVQWMARVELIVRIVVQLYLGLLVMVLPWLGFWTQNNVWTYSPVLFALGTSGFFRGLVSGLGLLNIVLAALLIRNLRGR